MIDQDPLPAIICPYPAMKQNLSSCEYAEMSWPAVLWKLLTNSEICAMEILTLIQHQHQKSRSWKFLHLYTFSIFPTFLLISESSEAS